MPTLRDALLDFTERLAHANVDSPRLSAEVLLCHALHIERTALLTEASHKLSSSELKKAKNYIMRRATGEPVAYITGHKEFYGFDFFVTPQTLIPRPETEHIIEKVLQLYEHNSPLRILDLGTGSGILAITLALLFPKSTSLALDIQQGALDIAQKNAKKHHVERQVNFLQADFTQDLSDIIIQADFDLIVSNPPYIETKEITQLSPEIINFEPHTALFSKRDGLDHVRGLLPNAQAALKKDGHLLIEIGSTQGETMLQLLRSPDSGFSQAQIHKDLAGFDRIASAIRNTANATDKITDSVVKTQIFAKKTQ